MQKTHVAVWIDRCSARVVELGRPGSPTFITYLSEMEARRRSAGNPTVPRTSQTREGTECCDEDHQLEHLERFYDRVLESVLHAEAILLIGPGEAKRELLGRMEHKGFLRARVLQTETASRMTDEQLLTRLRRFLATT
jgi:hypothetical protein